MGMRFDFKYLNFLSWQQNVFQGELSVSDMHEVRQALLTGERAEFQASGKRYIDTIFDDGESPLKHAHDIELKSSSFKWKYPLWYCSDILAKDCTWFEMARAGVWYTNTIRVEDCTF